MAEPVESLADTFFFPNGTFDTKGVNTFLVDLKEKFATETETTSVMKANLDNFFIIVMGVIVFLMQAGFAFLEAGAVRSKNTVNILIKNMLDALIGGVSYWAIGKLSLKNYSRVSNKRARTQYVF